MAAIFSFKSSCCERVHEGSPSFGFRAPDPYLQQPKEVQDAGSLGSEPIHGVSEPFMWGVWVSLSEKSFDRYVATYDHPDTSDSYFGWLCNYLPYYAKTHALKTRVHPRAGGDRPLVVLEKTDHPLSVDFHEGISISRAQEIAEKAMHR